MPLIESDLPAPRAVDVTVGPSIAVELEWALAYAERDDWRADHPVIQRIYEEHPDLAPRVLDMWGSELAVSCGGFMELTVLAHRGGLLLSGDAEAFLDALPELCSGPPLDPAELPLLAESPEDRRAILARIARLQESRELADQYVAIVRDVWAAIRLDWEMLGRPAVEVAVASRRELETKGADWHEVARSECHLGDVLDRTVTELGPGGQLAVVPAFFTHRGLIIDLPGVVVVGVRTDNTGAQARARTEALARRLKAISDPTRLAILDALRSGPRTVGDIATAFALAQPTVSNHVKILREAQLVTDLRDGTRRQLVVDHAELERLFSNLQDVLLEQAGSRLG
jgi:DNA-binding transcriptional ArsR family regulator